jgi:GMP synthase (glutamine-hydrolysing)
MVKKSLNELALLLIQPRADVPMIHHEIGCIAQYAQLQVEQLRSVSPFTSPINQALLEDIDGVIIGGSDTSVLDEFSWTPAIMALIRQIAAVKMPLFGSCWGHQMIARALGGEVVSDVARKEMGSIEVNLTVEGQQDPIFSQLPASFTAQSGHKDHVSRLPENIVPLAYSNLSPYQALRVKDLPIYGAQFHADLGAKELKERLSFYQYDYVDNSEYDQICAQLRESPEALTLFPRFIKQVILAGDNQ